MTTNDRSDKPSTNTMNCGQKSRILKRPTISSVMALAVLAFGLGLVRAASGEPKDAALCLAISLICIMSTKNRIPVCNQSVVTVANNIGITMPNDQAERRLPTSDVAGGKNP
jgi:citrate lyase alpha subunit